MCNSGLLLNHKCCVCCQCRVTGGGNAGHAYMGSYDNCNLNCTLALLPYKCREEDSDIIVLVVRGAALLVTLHKTVHCGVSPASWAEHSNGALK